MKLIDIIQESHIKNGKQEVGEQATALKSFFKGISNLTIKSLRTAKPVLAKDLQKVFNAKTIQGINKIDDLVVALGKGTLKGKALGDVAIGFMKTKGVSSNYIARLAPEFVNTPSFIKKYARDGKALTKTSLKNSGYTDDAIREILKASKNSQKFQNALKGAKGTSSTVKGTSSTVKGTTKGVSGTLKAAKGLGKQVVEKTKKFVTKVTPGAGKKIKSVAGTVIRRGGKILVGRALLRTLIIAGAAYIGYKWWTKGDVEIEEFPSDDDLDATKKWMECIVGVIEGSDRAHEIVIDGDNNSIQYDIETFGGVETGGHVVFYDDYRVVAKNGRTGKWSCDTTKELQEQSEDDVTSDMINNAIYELKDQLNGDFFEGDATDMKDAYKILKSFEGRTYKGSDAIQVIKKYYPQVVEKSLSDHIKSLKNLDFTAIEYRDEMLRMIGSSSDKGGSKSGDSDDSGKGGSSRELNHLTIIWDDVEGGGGSKGSKYKPCDDFPLKMYCISDKIKDVQKCMNPTAMLKVDGYFGPKTLKAMRDNSLFADNKSDDSIITKAIYDGIMKDCKEAKDAVKDADSEVKRPKVEPVDKIEVKPAVILTKLDAEGMIKAHGVDKLLDITKKRIDGERIAAIISDKVKFRGGRYVLKIDEELTEKQLKAINQYMAGKGFSLDKKNETLKDNKYVWVGDRDARRIARKEKSIDNIKSKGNE